MRIVTALGGNALVRRGERMTAASQRENLKAVVKALARLIIEGHNLIITHGNGPQVGLLALQSLAGPADGSYPLDILGAESEGMIGYMIEQELHNVLPGEQLIATLLTQIRVAHDDPAFANPSKPIGPVYTEAEAKRFARVRGWAIAPDGQGWRRVVPSPAPLEILEAHVIDYLVRGNVTVICAGGGGIPVVQLESGRLLGVEAVIDKDLASALLASNLNADHLLLLTDVDAVYSGWATPDSQPIRTATPCTLDLAKFAEGSMRPKVEAAIRFVRETGNSAGIGSIDDAPAILAGHAGTTVTPSASKVP